MRISQEYLEQLCKEYGIENGALVTAICGVIALDFEDNVAISKKYFTELESLLSLKETNIKLQEDLDNVIEEWNCSSSNSTKRENKLKKENEILKRNLQGQLAVVAKLLGEEGEGFVC